MRAGEIELYPIGEVKTRTGLTERRIRYYETLNLLTPRRTEGNQRLYSSGDIERLQEIKRLLDEGMSLKAVRQKMRDRDATPADDIPELERDAEGYFEGKRIAHGEAPRHGSLYPLRDRAVIMRRLARGQQEREDEF